MGNMSASKDFQIGFEEDLARALEERILSTKGDNGFAQLLQRAAKHWKFIDNSWSRRKEPGGAERLGRAFIAYTTDTDTLDIRAINAPLRTGLTSRFDRHVQSQLLEGLLELLSKGNEAEAHEAIEQVIEAHPSFVPALLLIGNRQFDDELFDEAAETAKKIHAIDSACPAAQDLLYKALLEKKKAGTLDSSPEIALQDLSDRFCASPFEMFLTSGGGGKQYPSVFACGCGGWLPFDISERHAEESVESIWNGSAVQEIRRSILDGDYSYCSRMQCAHIINDSLPKRDEIENPKLRDIIDNNRTKIDTGPTYVGLSHDPSCNLACPSCRVGLINVKNKDRLLFDEFTNRVILPLLEDTDVILNITGYGDPFGSKHYRRFIRDLDPVRHKGVMLDITTNGLLLTPKEWESIGEVRQLVKFVRVSIDAAKGDTYEDVRRPGKWGTLISSMTHLGELRARGEIPYFVINFVVQQKNYAEMPDFVDLGLGWNVDHIVFQKLANMGSYTQDVFEESNISDPRHPEHRKFLEILKHPNLSHEKVDMLNLSTFIE